MASITFSFYCIISPMPMQKTKIIATIGPSSSQIEVLKGMIAEGMSIARLNFSHGTIGEKMEQIEVIRRASYELGIRLGLMSDLQGPEVRTHMGKKELKIEDGDLVTVSGKEGIGEIKIKPSSVLRGLEPDDELYIDEGRIRLRVREVDGELLKCEVIQGGLVRDKRSVHASKPFELRGLTEEDKEAIKASISKGVDFIALSFVKSAEDVTEAMEFMRSISEEPPAIISKIETKEAVERIREILDVSYGIMVARGDLGVELPLQEVPKIQKKLIRLANQNAKPVITATEMLESMTQSPIPTRAEVTDVYNAILDGSDAIMLSAETAIGKYPVLSVRWMRIIAEMAESSLESRLDFPVDNIPSFIGKAAVEASEILKCPVIFCFTYSGYTARHVARHRPKARIIALSSNKRTSQLLTLTWGVETIDVTGDLDEALSYALSYCMDRGILSEEDRIVVTYGHPHGEAKTNTLRILSVRELQRAGTPKPSEITGPS
ncbi:pyruvate kinase [Candidatus Korarchaeum cryptofilum OPF8]|uniref:Pyruvate kinase n=2 Tax=Candidatus Korarchaeum cryptofilum TaxID=498846 RepID=B1L381_KORCO|nr:pyruvate kinase [Candidatus Korarchaeum cryptofilum OPF8]